MSCHEHEVLLAGARDSGGRQRPVQAGSCACTCRGHSAGHDVVRVLPLRQPAAWSCPVPSHRLDFAHLLKARILVPWLELSNQYSISAYMLLIVPLPSPSPLTGTCSTGNGRRHSKTLARLRSSDLLPYGRLAIRSLERVGAEENRCRQRRRIALPIAMMYRPAHSPLQTSMEHDVDLRH